MSYITIYSRALELSYIFLLVWYYCTLTIRESILKVNGSRIKGWWRFHHFFSTVVAGILLIWPDMGPWAAFRNQFMWFNAYIGTFRNTAGTILFSTICIRFRRSTIPTICLSEGGFVQVKSVG